MTDPIRITLGGYGPANTTCSRGLKVLGDTLSTQFGNEIAVHTVWNVMDFGYKAADLLWMAETGVLSLTYQSTSYIAYRVLGFFENGYRHLSNQVRPVRTLEDMKDMKIRIMPGEIHRRSFELIGAAPCPLDLKPGLEAIVSGAVDGQENPLANTVDYDAHKVHRYHTLSGHCYHSRGIYMNRAQFDRWPQALQEGMRAAARKAVLAQRDLAVEEERLARAAIIAAGGEVVELTADARRAFALAVKPLHDEARQRFGDAAFAMIPQP